MIKFLLAIYFVFPKINIISFPGFITGIRVDDIAALGILICILVSKKIPRTSIDNLVLIYLILITVSFIGNLNSVSLWNVLSYLRIIEYLVISISLIHFLNFKEIVLGIKIYLVLNLIYCILQWGLGFPGFASIGLLYDLSRLYGLTGGAWELGAIAAISAIYISIYDYSYNDSKPSRIFLIICAALIIFSASRSQIPVLPIIFLAILGFSLDKSYKNIFRLNQLPVFLGLLIIGYYGFNYLFFSYQNLTQSEARAFVEGGGIVARSVEVISIENIKIFSDLFNDPYISSSRDSITGGSNWSVDYGSHPEADDSFLIRAYKWVNVLNVLIQNPYNVIFGFGPGALGDALDGGFLRSFAEYGIFFAFYIYFILKRLLKFPNILMILSFFIPTMLLIDIHLSSKVQPLILSLAIFSNFFNPEKKHESGH